MSNKYGLLGERLGHSFSPELHRRLGYPGSEGYALLEVAPTDLAAFLTARDFAGINVTIPYKQAVIPFLDEISPRARAIGAVNTVVNRDGRLFGDNTDFGGLQALLETLGQGDLRGRTVLIAGTGGTSRTAMAVARQLGAAEIVRMSRRPAGDSIGYEAAYDRYGGAQLLINTTPVGMYPEPERCPVDLDRLPGLEAVADVIYNPMTTELVRRARSRGLRAENGFYMLVVQGVLAAERFIGSPLPPDTAARVYREILFEKRSILLTGMPGSGKTTLGRLLSARLGRPLQDTDELIVRQAGMPITELFKTRGEEYFRDLETGVLRELCKTGGQLIATGGGAVLRQENVDAMKRNGVVVFLDRDAADLLPTDDRPLADDGEKIRNLYRTRGPIYRAAADVTVPVTGTPEETAEELLRRLQ